MLNLNRLTKEELKELFILKEKLFQGDSFKVVDFKNKEDKRYNDLMLKAFGNSSLEDKNGNV